MTTTLTRLSLLAGALCLSSPVALWAHEGHAGDHGWLAGAAQPLPGPDHFLAALFIAAVVTLGLSHMGRRRAGRNAPARR